MRYDYDHVECMGSRLIPEYTQLTDHCMEGNIMIAHIALTTSVICTSALPIVMVNTGHENSGSTNCNTTNKINMHHKTIRTNIATNSANIFIGAMINFMITINMCIAYLHVRQK
jgi:hypothetical protein